MLPYHSLTDEQLTGLLKTGEEDAFTEIYNRYWKLLYHTAHNILQDPEIAQDVIQNVYISLWQRREDVEIFSLKPYLRQSTRFSVLKVIREKKKDAHFFERLQEITTEIIADNPLIFKEQQELLRTLLGSLSEECRETFILSREQGFTYRQIASQLNISEKTVEKRMSKSLKHIRSGLNWEMCTAIAVSSICITS